MPEQERTTPPLPPGLPAPVDDGAADHLTGAAVPETLLPSTEGQEVDLSQAESLVLYVFPKIGRPDKADPPGWDEVPGARGCTQQSCTFRDLHDEFRDLGYRVMGLSAQPTDEQQEAARRLHLPFPLLADPARRMSDAIGLPTFEFAGMELYRRCTLVIRNASIVKVFYPVFPPDANAAEILEWLRSNE